MTPEAFAQSVIDDYGLSSSYHSIITKSIQEQLSDFKAHSALLAAETDNNSPIDDDGEEWMMLRTSGGALGARSYATSLVLSAPVRC